MIEFDIMNQKLKACIIIMDMITNNVQIVKIQEGRE